MIKHLLFGLSLASLSACANITTPGQAGEAARASLPDAPDAWAMASERVGPVEAGWVAQLEDPVLSALVAEALANNRNLQAAAANVQRSWALAGQAGAGLSPSVSLSSGATRSGNIEDTGGDSYSLTGVQALSLRSYRTFVLNVSGNEGLGRTSRNRHHCVSAGFFRILAALGVDLSVVTPPEVK